MRYVVLADIHSNLEALEACLQALKQEKVDGYLVLGDIVGYGANPNECVKKVRELANCKAIMGNHDLASIGKMDLEWFSQDAKEALIWTSKNLDKTSRAFLEKLPERLELSDEHLLCVHGSPRSPIEEYLDTPDIFLANLQFQGQPLCLVGHRHVPFCFCLNKKEEKLSYDYLKSNIELTYNIHDELWAINPGSVGQPRDGNPKASFAILDMEKRSFRILRTDYSLKAAQEKIRRAGLPEILAERLPLGR